LHSTAVKDGEEGGSLKGAEKNFQEGESPREVLTWGISTRVKQKREEDSKSVLREKPARKEERLRNHSREVFEKHLGEGTKTSTSRRGDSSLGGTTPRRKERSYREFWQWNMNGVSEEKIRRKIGVKGEGGIPREVPEGKNFHI